MPRNVEIKVRLEDAIGMRVRVREIADAGPELIVQDDTFFHSPEGRLKLRVFADGSGELIYYQRADTTGPKESFYLLAAADDPDALRNVLAHAYGVIGRVRKVRTLFLSGRTRLHLDSVEGLGEFLELEVVLNDGETVGTGKEEAHRLLERLGVNTEQLVEGAYMDLARELRTDTPNTDTLPRGDREMKDGE